MNKPPERIIYVTSGYNPPLEHFQRAFILEEEKPMTQKTENLTEKEAWIAMANGECVMTRQYIHRINYGHVEFWDGKWLFTGRLSVGPYSIVEDPSKPKEVKEIGNDYTKSREKIILQEACHDDIANMILHHMDRFFVRKP